MEVFFGNPNFFDKFETLYTKTFEKNFDKKNGKLIWPPEQLILVHLLDNRIPIKKSTNHYLKGDIWKIKGYN